MDIIQVKKLEESAILPRKEHPGDLGYDIFATESKYVKIGDSDLIDTGIAIQLPDGWGCFVKDRSSYAYKKKLETSAGVIDNGYQGELKILIRNHSGSAYNIEPGDKIAQIVPIPVTNFGVQEVGEFGETERGQDGFGSTGEKEK